MQQSILVLFTVMVSLYYCVLAAATTIASAINVNESQRNPPFVIDEPRSTLTDRLTAKSVGILSSSDWMENAGGVAKPNLKELYIGFLAGYSHSKVRT